MAGEEAVQITASAAQKAMEISVELLKTIVFPTINATGRLLKKGISKTAETIKDKANSAGNVPRNALLNEAGYSNSAILSSENLFSEDVGKIAVRAKQENIPIHIIGNGNKQTIEFLERDKAVMQNIMQETIVGNIKSNPDEYMQFAIGNSNIEPMKEMLEKNGVQCCFTQANGKIFCSYHAYDAEKVSAIKQDFKNMRDELNFDLKVERSNSKLGLITDAKSGKSVDLSQFGGNVRQYQVVNALQKELGYSKEKAMLAANKVCDDLKLNPRDYFAHTEQFDSIKSFKTNIKFENDDILLRNVSFSEVYFKGGENPHISIINGENAVTITPDKMTAEQIKETCINHLGMSEQQAEKATDKAVKINEQIKSKYQEHTVNRNTGLTQSAEIERTSKNSFTLTVGNTKKQYNLNDEKLAEKLKSDLGISAEKAERIIGKAKKQSAFLNNLGANSRRITDNPKKQTNILHTEKTSKGARK